MSMLAFLLLASARFDFVGGTTAELAKAMGEATGKPVVLMDAGDVRQRAAKFQWDTPRRFGRESRLIYGFRPVLPTEDDASILGFGTAWTEDLLAGGRARVSGDLVVENDTVNTGGKVLTGPASRFAAGDLHWFLARVPVAVYVKSSSKEELRKAVLTAVGADSKGEPRWPEMKLRFAQSCRQIAKDWRAREMNPYEDATGDTTWVDRIASMDLKATVFGEMSNTDLAAAFAEEGAQRSLTLPASALSKRSGLTFIKAQFEEASKKGSGKQFQSPYGDLRDLFGANTPVNFALISPFTLKFFFGDNDLRMEFDL